MEPASIIYISWMAILSLCAVNQINNNMNNKKIIRSKRFKHYRLLK
jgi:hypothetical protein